MILTHSLDRTYSSATNGPVPLRSQVLNHPGPGDFLISADLFLNPLWCQKGSRAPGSMGSVGSGFQQASGSCFQVEVETLPLTVFIIVIT